MFERNLNDMGTYRNVDKNSLSSKYHTISANFVEIPLITFAQYCKTAFARTVSMLYYWHGTHFVIYTVAVLIFSRTKAIVSTVLSNTKEIFNEQNPNTVVLW